MKKFIAFMGLALVLVGCGPKAELLSYTSEDLGLSFEYLDLSYEQEVTVSEEGDTVSLLVEDVSIADLTVKEVDVSSDVLVALNAVLLNNSEACVVEALYVGEDKSIYGFDSVVYPFGDEFDDNCLLTAGIYVYPGVTNKVVLIDSGHAAPYDGEETEAFANSISLK
mgnify:CR=1 FL=1|jgi:hypothetical protein